MYLTIKDLRLSEHFSQKELANKIHISRSYLSKLERNIPATVKGVRLGTIEELAKALNVSVNSIIKD